MPGLLRSTAALGEQLGPIAGGREGIALPFQFIFTGEDGLRLFVNNVAPLLRLRLVARWLQSGSSEVTPLSYDFTPDSSGADGYFHIPLGRGVLLNLVVVATNSIAYRGQCYIRVDVERGRDAHVVLGTLLAGYIDASGGRAWPGSPLETSVDGPGWIHRASGVTPAAGAQPQLIQPAVCRRRLMSVRSSLTTSATVIDRYVYLTISQDSAIVYYGPLSIPIPQSTGSQLVFAPGAPLAADTVLGIRTAPLPTNCYLHSTSPGDAILTLQTSGLQPGDQFSDIELLCEEWRAPITVEPN